MTMHVITPKDLLEFQIKHYSEMKPRNLKHKIFLRKTLKQLQNERILNTVFDNRNDSLRSANYSNNILYRKNLESI